MSRRIYIYSDDWRSSSNLFSRADITIVLKLMRLSASSACGARRPEARDISSNYLFAVRGGLSPRTTLCSIFLRLTQRAELMWPLAVKSIGIRRRASAREGSHILRWLSVDPRSPPFRRISSDRRTAVTAAISPCAFFSISFFVLIALRNRGELREGY